jgi:hypothetical protein
LQALTVNGRDVPVSIAAQLTGLTSLIIDSNNSADVEQMFRVAGQNTGLVKLKFRNYAPLHRFRASHHQFTLLSNCPSLTQLDMRGLQIDGQALDLLLTHCTSITRLTLGGTTLDSSRADRQCSWRKLSLQGSSEGILSQLAYLPLRSVQELEVSHDEVSCKVVLPLPASVPAAQLPSLLHQAATNLASCPAWISAAPSYLDLQGGGQGLTAELVQLFQALAPLGGPHVTKVTIGLLEQLELGSAEVQALASCIGGSLRTLTLGICTLQGTFWKALAHHLPHLSFISLGVYGVASAMDIAAYLSIRSCSSLQPLCLGIYCWHRDEESRLRLEEHITRWQLPNLTLKYQ